MWKATISNLTALPSLATVCVLLACGSDDSGPGMLPSAQSAGSTGSSGSSGSTPSAAGSSGPSSSASGTGARPPTMSSGGRSGAAGSTARNAGGAAPVAGMAGTAAGSQAMPPAAGSGMVAGAGAAGAAGGGAKMGSGVADGPDNSAPCTPSMMNKGASGSGKYKVVIETNSDPGINEGTIYRPEDLSGAERFPIFIWGEGGCARQGLSNQAANAEIASHGYFVVADGTPSGGGGNRSLGGADAGKPMIAYIDWAIAENNKPCSAYYHKLDPTKVATNGFSCGGLMAQGTAGDPRVTTWMINSSGGFMANSMLYEQTHGPVLIVQGGPTDIAYENGKRDYENLAKGKYPVMLFSKDIGHGGDLFAKNGGDFTKLNLSWLNWWLKGDEGMSGKGFLVGDGCSLCKDSSWETASANIP